MNNFGDSSVYRTNEGYYELEYRENGVYLIVHPPVGKGKKVESKDVIDRLTRKKVMNFRRDIVELACQKANNTPMCIAEYQEEVKIDAQVSVTVSPDKMKASIYISPPDGGKTVTIQDIIDVLNKNGVCYGISKTNLENVVKYPVYYEAILIAEGSMPVNGQSGRVQFYFETNKDKKPTILDDGTVDFRELNIVECVQKGKVLCELIPPQSGVPGKTVDGKEIPALDGKPAKLPRGKNVKVSEDGQQLIAEIDGQVNYIDGKVNVFSNYEVPADVDNSTGNVNFIGNVTVRGNVLSGFTIEAGGTVEVMGVVEAATIIAGGDIILRRGMQGSGKGVLISGGDIIARYIENSNIQAKGDIKSEAIMHSNIKCGNKLELSGKKGLLIGGVCKVGKEISAKVIGSYMATVTEIEVGIDPSLKERYKQIREELVVMEEDIKKADQAINILKKLEMTGGLSPEKHEIMAKSVRTKLHFTNKTNELKQEYLEIEQRLQQEAHGKVRASNYIYPGTKVSIGTCVMYVKENLQYCCLYRDGADVRVGAYDK